jgi:predicted chitinase
MSKKFIVVTLLILFFLFRKRIINNSAKFSNLPSDMRDNAKIVFDALISQGYNNPYTLAAMLATIERESNFIPKTELSYKNTSAFRIKKIFSSKLGHFSDAFIDKLKKNDVNFFGAVYGGRYGNNTSGDGFKYRGRGFNQITFKDTYKKVGDKIGVDLVNNPDELNRVSVATKALIVFWEDKIRDAMKSGKWAQYFQNELNNAQSQEEANKMLLKLNGGWNLSYNTEMFKFLQIHAPAYFDLITDP